MEISKLLSDPIGDSSIVPSYIIQSKIKNYSNVCLGGDGGDESFFGYITFDAFYLAIKFKKIFPNYIYEIQYEKFVQDPEIESKKLFKFCNLIWNKKCLEFYKRKDLISKTASNVQIREAIYRHYLDKYLPYKKYLDKYGKKYSWYN